MKSSTGLLYFYYRRPYTGLLALVLSICIHLLLFLLIVYLIKHEPIKTVSAENEQKSIRVTLNPPESPKVQEKENIQPPRSKILTTDRSDSTHIVPSKPTKPQTIPQKRGLQRFLPSSDPEYLNKLRQQQKPQEITGDAGDIPIQGQYRRRDIPMVVDRTEHRDLTLYQFSKMFHDRFGAIWNSKERLVPPSSPLRPGDIVYYKVFINPDGTLDHIENLTNKIRPGLNTEALDDIFEEVIQQTLPMELPAKLEKSMQVTEVIAVQVVNRTLFMNFKK